MLTGIIIDFFFKVMQVKLNKSKVLVPVFLEIKKKNDMNYNHRLTTQITDLPIWQRYYFDSNILPIQSEQCLTLISKYKQK